MQTESSVTQWIDDLKVRGDERAAQRLYDRFAARLLELARKKLKTTGGKRRVADEEDVVLSALDSFFSRAKDGKFPKLTDRDNLWPLLMKITERKVIDLVQHERRDKRGGGIVRGESAFIGAGDERGGFGDAGVDPNPSPEFAAQFAEDLDRLLSKLDDANLRNVAVRKLEGFTTEEIAQELGCSSRTVKQKTALIRKLWEADLQ